MVEFPSECFGLGYIKSELALFPANFMKFEGLCVILKGNYPAENMGFLLCYVIFNSLYSFSPDELIAIQNNLRVVQILS